MRVGKESRGWSSHLGLLVSEALAQLQLGEVWLFNFVWTLRHTVPFPVMGGEDHLQLKSETNMQS